MRWRPTREARMMAAILAMGFAGALAPGLRSTVAAQAPPGSIGTTTATMPDGACSMNDRRFVDCGNGTVTDQVTGLIWLKDAACLGFQDYDGANRAAASLHAGQCGLSDNSSPGQWRVPSPADWSRTTADRCAGSPISPALTDNSGTLCYLTVPDGTDLYERALVGVAYYYWTSEYLNPLSFDIPRVGAALAVNLDTNSIYILDTTALLRTWAVRGRTN